MLKSSKLAPVVVVLPLVTSACVDDDGDSGAAVEPEPTAVPTVEQPTATSSSTPTEVAKVVPALTLHRPRCWSSHTELCKLPV